MKNESGSTTDPEDSEETKEADLSAEEIVSALSASSGVQLKQKHWRWVGAICLLVAGAMTVYATNTNILRDSMISVALIFFEGTSDPSPAYPLLVYILYWGIFLLCIVVAVYMVVLDLRYIRLEYVLEKRSIMKEAWEDEDFRKAINAAQEKEKE